MKKKILLFSIPFVLLAAFLSLGFLPFLLLPFIILAVNYFVNRKENNTVVQEMKGRLSTAWKKWNWNKVNLTAWWRSMPRRQTKSLMLSFHMVRQLAISQGNTLE